MQPIPIDSEPTTLLVVSDLDRARSFYRDALGATLEGEYGGTSLVFKLGTGWLLIVTGGGPTTDKPDTEFDVPQDPARIDHEIVFGVPDCQASYEELTSRGVEFLTPPVTYEHEVRAFFRDPDGHLFEISEKK